jgi:hypothetical protein
VRIEATLSGLVESIGNAESVLGSLPLHLLDNFDTEQTSIAVRAEYFDWIRRIWVIQSLASPLSNWRENLSFQFFEIIWYPLNQIIY